MNDEIKEKMTIGKAKKILRGFLAKDCYYDTPLYYAIPYLLDYITNLQQEKESWQRVATKNFNKAEDYKSRIEKAVEYIMSELVDEWSIKNDGYVDGSDLPVNAITPILDILNGRSDE